MLWQQYMWQAYVVTLVVLCVGLPAKKGKLLSIKTNSVVLFLIHV